MNLRNRKDSMASQASGSIYNESQDIDDAFDEDAEGEDEDNYEENIGASSPEKKEYTRSRSGRRILKSNYVESDDDFHQSLKTSPHSVNVDAIGSPDEEESAPRRPGLRSRTTRSRANGPVFSSDDGESMMDSRRYKTRSQSKKPEFASSSRTSRATLRNSQRHTRSRVQQRDKGRHGATRASRDMDADIYVDEPDASVGSSDAEMDDVPRTSSDIEPEPEPDDIIVDGGDDDGIEQMENADGKPYALRRRAKVNYAIPPPLDEIPFAPPKEKMGSRLNGNKKKGLGWSANGTELGRFLGLPGPDDSDSDTPTRVPGRGLNGPAFTGGMGTAPSGFSDLAAAAGTPSNFGKISSNADIDPLGVNQNVTFDEVGGLDDHINSLKEMTLLPLLYPEVFQRFGLTPPRGVLFHGPPGTGKTLLARALAASTRSNGKGISFFMRKGADVLSKWVGEAERQLRLLFEEARNCQPSIIFFDEIDGLAPVRSSKQDQIHASIVSTLLALMDGMDGRGQVVVIGATNRPDAVDPALRRPGRFDREFYFPLPNLAAREKILGIMTKDWEGWSGERGSENLSGLAKLTKGYGGADLRALCTEAALNAVQRRYPQIYKSNDRLLLKPETIGVELRDFMISVKKIVPSSARSSSSTASPLPTQLVPLLSESLERVKAVLDRVLPTSKKRTALEEAEYEDEGPEGALQRELMLQSMETLRVFRPRLLLCGSPGMGQNYVATAALHHLEGYHVQNLDLGSLLGDATRTPEAAIVQLFVEAKRHQPSVIYIPSLVGWCSAVSDTARSTMQSMLSSLAPTDPILLLAVIDGAFQSLPRDVRAWFGSVRSCRIEITAPDEKHREAFFEDLLKDTQRPPSMFPDGVARKKRVLEELPIAPPLAPRQPSVAELALQQENDGRVLTLLKFRLGPIISELKKKHKRFTKSAMDEYRFPVVDEQIPPLPIVVEPVPVQNGDANVELNGAVDGQQSTTAPDHDVMQQEQVQMQIEELPVPPPPPSLPPPPALPQLFDVDLEIMHRELFKDRYLTPQEFLEDIAKIVHNARVCAHMDAERLVRAETMFNAAQLSIQDFDHGFRIECERMAERERQRRAERKKEREKLRASARASAEAEARASQDPVGIRRSARNNGLGLEPDFEIRDPLALERSLKRQRSADAQATGSGTGEEEREPKRSRVTSEEATPVEQPQGSIPVHDSLVNGNSYPAVNDIVHAGVQQPLPFTSMDPSGLVLPQFEAVSEPVLPPLPPNPAFGFQDADVGMLSSFSQQPNLEPTAPQRTGGFDPSLLNPTSPSDRFIRHPGTSTGQFGTSDVGATADLSNQCDPVLVPPPAFSQQDSDMNGRVNSPTPQPAPPAQVLPPISAVVSVHEDAMVIERTPTPQPEFIVDELLLSELRTKLVRDTALLNVEQLEQLRATALSAVWRHRMAWNRRSLLGELIALVDEFVDEARLDSDDQL